MASIALNQSGIPFTIAGALARLFQESAPTPAPVAASDPPLDGITGRWDATAMAPTVTSLPNGIYTIPDTSGAGHNMSSGGTAVRVIPHLAGLLNGLYAEGQLTNYSLLHPIINDSTLTASSVAVGAGGAFTVFLAWSRAKLRAGSTSVPLLSIGGTEVLRLGSAGNGSDALTLFPASTAISAGSLPLRHTHAARLVFNGATVDLWLDGAKIISAAANQITLGSTATLAFLGNSQLVFHEAITWGRALSGGGPFHRKLRQLLVHQQACCVLDRCAVIEHSVFVQRHQLGAHHVLGPGHL
jgi:hypothetical protein